MLLRAKLPVASDLSVSALRPISQWVMRMGNEAISGETS